LLVINQFPIYGKRPVRFSICNWHKKIFKKKGEVKINISDIFNHRAYFYHDLDNNEKYQKSSKDVLAISRNYGTNYTITFSYNIK
jgi:hypothetical protein